MALSIMSPEAGPACTRAARTHRVCDRIARMGGLSAFVAVLVSCSGDNPRIPEFEGSSAMALGEVPAGPYAWYGHAGLCIDRPGSIDIVDITLQYSEGGLEIDGYAVSPSDAVDRGVRGWETRGPDAKTIWDLGYKPDSLTVNTVCHDHQGTAGGDEAAAMSLGIQFTKPTDETARAAGIEVHYRSGRRTYQHVIQVEIVLCTSTQEWEPACDPRDPSDFGW